MPPRYAARRASSDPAAASWAQIWLACVQVIEAARSRGQLEDVLWHANAALATVKRMAADLNYHGWTGPRIIGLRTYEETKLGTTSIREAMGSGAAAQARGCAEDDADHLMPALLRFGAAVSEARPNGFNRTERRRLLQPLDALIEDAKRLRRDLRASLTEPGS